MRVPCLIYFLCGSLFSFVMSETDLASSHASDLLVPFVGRACSEYYLSLFASQCKL